MSTSAPHEKCVHGLTEMEVLTQIDPKGAQRELGLPALNSPGCSSVVALVAAGSFDYFIGGSPE